LSIPTAMLGFSPSASELRHDPVRKSTSRREKRKEDWTAMVEEARKQGEAGVIGEEKAEEEFGDN